MVMKGKEELFDEKGNIPVWGSVSSSGKPYYTFNITEEDKYVMFPQSNQNSKAPKFIIKKARDKKVEE